MRKKTGKSSSSTPARKQRRVIDNDPIYEFISKMPVPLVWLAAVLGNLIVYIPVGLVMKHIYPSTPHLQHITDIAEIVNGINVWVVWIPCIWAYYRWLPEAALRCVATLEEWKVLSSTATGETLAQVIRRRLSTKWMHAFGLFSASLSFCYMMFIWIPSQNIVLGAVNFWFYTIWTKVFFFLLYVPANHVLFVFLLRLIVVVVTIHQHFRRPGSIARLYPLHPDKCGGMGEIGLLISRMVLIFVVVPIFMTMDAYLMPLLAGSIDSQLEKALIVYGLYLLIVPTVLFLLLYQPHKAMERYKHARLMDISVKLLDFQGLLAETNGERAWEKLKGTQEKYKLFENSYDIFNKQIPTWPISLPALRQFGAFASSPIVVGSITLGIEYLLKGLFGG